MGRSGAPVDASWRRSGACTGADATCVEVLVRDGKVIVRDSKDTDGPTLRFTALEWRAFVRGVRAGDFDLAGPDCRGQRMDSSTARRKVDDVAGSSA